MNNKLLKLYATINGNTKEIGLIDSIDNNIEFSGIYGFQGVIALKMLGANFTPSWVATFKYFMANNLRVPYIITFGVTEKIEFCARVKEFELSSHALYGEGSVVGISFDLTGAFDRKIDGDVEIDKIWNGEHPSPKPDSGTWL